MCDKLNLLGEQLKTWRANTVCREYELFRLIGTYAENENNDEIIDLSVDLKECYEVRRILERVLGKIKELQND